MRTVGTIVMMLTLASAAVAAAPGREPNRREQGATRNAHVRDNNRSVKLLKAH